MIRLVYVSSTDKDWQADDLLALLKNCRIKNGARNITGILLYSNNTFFQVLEGEKDDVESVFEKIKKDDRHRDVTLIEKTQITERQFPYWSMGFEKIDPAELSHIKGLNNFFEDDFSAGGFIQNKNVIAPLLKHFRAKLVDSVTHECHEELPEEHEDPFISLLHRIIRLAVKGLALLMVLVIVFSVFDVMYVLYEKLLSEPKLLLTMDDILETFGSFLVVLIAIEIFINITLYIRSDVIPVKLVVATALMAISRKVIVFDFKVLPYEYVAASSCVVLALGITYWLVQKK
ncbi:MAG: phosphate-starvation-inducible PsiE family protein [Gammaproteobacteria bacterium]